MTVQSGPQLQNPLGSCMFCYLSYETLKTITAFQSPKDRSINVALAIGGQRKDKEVGPHWFPCMAVLRVSFVPHEGMPYSLQIFP